MSLLALTRKKACWLLIFCQDQLRPIEQTGKIMDLAKARTALVLAAGAASAVFAMIAAPTAVAAPPNPVCSNGEVAMDGTCAPPMSMDPTSDAMELPDARASDLDNDFSPGDFTPSGAPSEAFLSERGY
jgi:hypothetical protein